MHRATRDLLAGLAFVVFGAAFAYAASRYQLGTAFRMGPGYFPVVLGAALVLLGLLVAVEGLFTGQGGEINTPPWRAIVLILGAIVFFGVAIRGLGLVPTLFVAVLMASFASRRTSVTAALLIAVGLTVACFLIFVEALGLSIPLLGLWIGTRIGL